MEHMTPERLAEIDTRANAAKEQNQTHKMGIVERIAFERTMCGNYPRDVSDLLAEVRRLTDENASIRSWATACEEQPERDGVTIKGLLDENARLTAENESLKRERDAAVDTITRIDYQLEKHQVCAAMGNRQYAHGIRDARKIIADMLPACAENAPEVETKSDNWPCGQAITTIRRAPDGAESEEQHEQGN